MPNSAQNNDCNQGRLYLSFLVNVTPQIRFVLCVMKKPTVYQLLWSLP